MKYYKLPFLTFYQQLSSHGHPLHYNCANLVSFFNFPLQFVSGLALRHYFSRKKSLGLPRNSIISKATHTQSCKRKHPVSILKHKPKYIKKNLPHCIALYKITIILTQIIAARHRQFLSLVAAAVTLHYRGQTLLWNNLQNECVPVREGGLAPHL